MGEPDQPVETEDEAKTEETHTSWIVWDNRFNFETRELTRSDLVGLGADPEDEKVKGLEWTPSNNWRVVREDIPLTDIQLGGLLALEKSFRLVEK